MVSMYRLQTEITGLPGGSGLSTFHFLASGGSGQQAQDAVDLFWDAIESHIMLGIGMAGTDELVTFEDTTGEAISFTAVSGQNHTGTQTGEPLPKMTNGLIAWKTGSVLAGRRVQGRTFVPAPGEAANEGAGVPTAQYVAELNGAASALLNAVGASPAVWSRPIVDPETDEVLREGASAEITAGVGWNQWAVLRSRRG